MRFTNINSQDQLRILASDEFEVVNGDPRFNKKYVTLSAQQAAQEWIRHNYRQGWEQI
jgi:hypothetical protein